MEKWIKDKYYSFTFENKEIIEIEQMILRLKLEGGINLTTYGTITNEDAKISDINFDIIVVD